MALGLRRVAGAVLHREAGVARSAAVFDVAGSNDASHGSDGCLEGQPLRGPHVELPPEERRGEPLREHEAVAELPLFGREVALAGVAHQPERLIASAVHDLEEHGAAGAGGRLGHEDEEVGCELHFAGRVGGSASHIGDAAVGAEPRIDGEVHAPDDPLVAAVIVTAADVDADHFGRGRRRTEPHDERARGGAPHVHGCRRAMLTSVHIAMTSRNA